MILLTGATGFVGSHIARRLLAAGEELRCIVRDPARAAAYLRYEAELVRADLLEPESLAEAMVGVDGIIHLVGIIRESRRASFEGVHVRATRNLLEAAREANVRRFVHMSALGSRRGSHSRYYETKWLAEESVRKSGLDYTILRPSVIFGEEDQFINMLAGMVKQLPVLPRFEAGSIQPVWVEDVASCFVGAVEDYATAGRGIDLAGPQAYSLDEVIDRLCEVLEVDKPRVKLPGPLLWLGGWLGEYLPFVPLTREQVRLLGEDNTCDIGGMVETFGVRPRALEDYLKEHFGAGAETKEAAP